MSEGDTHFFQKSLARWELVSIKEPTFHALRQYEIKPGDLYISIAGSIGSVGVYLPLPRENVRTILTENAARLVPTSELNPDFVAAQMNSSLVQRQIDIEKGIGGGVPKLALFRIENLRLLWPTLGEQCAIADRLKIVNLRGDWRSQN